MGGGGDVEDNLHESSNFSPTMGCPQSMLERLSSAWGVGVGVSVKEKSPSQARQGPPTSPALRYKRERWSAARQWLLQTHKDRALAPQETLRVRIATARTFVSVD